MGLLEPSHSRRYERAEIRCLDLCSRLGLVDGQSARDGECAVDRRGDNFFASRCRKS